jgi:Antitoxin-like ribbon-helix-helix
VFSIALWHYLTLYGTKALWHALNIMCNIFKYMRQELKSVTDRTSKKLVFRCDPPEIKRLKQIALDNDMTLNALLIEGVNLVLQKYESKTKK